MYTVTSRKDIDLNQQEKPIILFTNDDGIESPGLWTVVEAFKGVGELLVVAMLLKGKVAPRSIKCPIQNW